MTRPRRVALITVALAVALALPGNTAAGGTLPRQGVLAPAKSLAGVKLGDTPAKVRARWGRAYRLCPICSGTTWLYTYPRGTPVGAAVTFRKGRATAVFTLGAPPGWRTTEGVKTGDPADRAGEVYGELDWTRCIGYGALSMRGRGVVTSIYTYGESVYGFALTRPSEPVCQ